MADVIEITESPPLHNELPVGTRLKLHHFSGVTWVVNSHENHLDDFRDTPYLYIPKQYARRAGDALSGQGR